MILELIHKYFEKYLKELAAGRENKRLGSQFFDFLIPALLMPHLLQILMQNNQSLTLPIRYFIIFRIPHGYFITWHVLLSTALRLQPHLLHQLGPFHSAVHHACPQPLRAAAHLQSPIHHKSWVHQACSPDGCTTIDAPRSNVFAWDHKVDRKYGAYILSQHLFLIRE